MILLLLLLLQLADVRPLTTLQVCQTKWGLDARHVSAAMKQQVFARDRIPWATRTRYVVDHRVPRELAGADVLVNLWVQPLADAHLKDRDENRLHRAVCAGTLSLAVAQQQMRLWKTP